MKQKFTDDISLREDPSPIGIPEEGVDVTPVPRDGLPMDAVSKFARTVRDMAITNGKGWWSVLRSLGVSLARIFTQMPLLTLLFLGFSFLTCLSVILPWMTYQVVLLGNEPETVGIGSAFKLFFFLPGAYGLFIIVFGFPRRVMIYYGLVVLAALAYALGIYEPRWIHTAMLKRGDFTFTIWMTVYGVALGLAALLVLRGALNTAVFEIRELMALAQSEPRESL